MTTATRTYTPTPGDIDRRWFVVDADGAVLGRLASEVAQVLRGKHKPMWAPHVDVGDHVIVVNAGRVRLTGGKETKKIAYRHSGYPGGLKETGYERLLRERPSFVVEKAIKGMLPKTRLGRAMARKLQVYDGAEHPHAAQQPVALGLGEVPRWEGLPAREAKPQPKAASTTGPKPRRKAAGAGESKGGRGSTRPGGRGSDETTKKRSTARPAGEKKAGAAKDTTARKSTAKQPAAKKTSAKKPAARKTSAKPDAPKRSRASKKEE